MTVTNFDGNVGYDVAGSYGVNVFGYDFYRACIDAAVERARGLGPVLGSYHTRSWSTMRGACARSRAWTRCRSTCRAPRR